MHEHNVYVWSQWLLISEHWTLVPVRYASQMRGMEEDSWRRDEGYSPGGGGRLTARRVNGVRQEEGWRLTAKQEGWKEAVR